MEKGFLIEKTIAGTAMYLFLTPSGAWSFTTDSHKAIRFCRDVDAREFCRGAEIHSALFVNLGHTAIVEHQWG